MSSILLSTTSSTSLLKPRILIPFRTSGNIIIQLTVQSLILSLTVFNDNLFNPSESVSIFTSCFELDKKAFLPNGYADSTASTSLGEDQTGSDFDSDEFALDSTYNDYPSNPGPYSDYYSSSDYINDINDSIPIPPPPSSRYINNYGASGSRMRGPPLQPKPKNRNPLGGWSTEDMENAPLMPHSMTMAGRRMYNSNIDYLSEPNNHHLKSIKPAKMHIDEDEYLDLDHDSFARDPEPDSRYYERSNSNWNPNTINYLNQVNGDSDDGPIMDDNILSDSEGETESETDAVKSSSKPPSPKRGPSNHSVDSDSSKASMRLLQEKQVLSEVTTIEKGEPAILTVDTIKIVADLVGDNWNPQTTWLQLIRDEDNHYCGAVIKDEGVQDIVGNAITEAVAIQEGTTQTGAKSSSKTKTSQTGGAPIRLTSGLRAMLARHRQRKAAKAARKARKDSTSGLSGDEQNQLSISPDNNRIVVDVYGSTDRHLATCQMKYSDIVKSISVKNSQTVSGQCWGKGMTGKAALLALSSFGKKLEFLLNLQTSELKLKVSPTSIDDIPRLKENAKSFGIKSGEAHGMKIVLKLPSDLELESSKGKRGGFFGGGKGSSNVSGRMIMLKASI